MTLPSQTYTLVPAVDGKQRMGDWDGTYTPPVELPAPTNLRITSYGVDYINYAYDYAVDSGHAGFVMDASVGPDNFQPQPDIISAEARTYRLSTAPGQYTGARIKAVAPTPLEATTILSVDANSATELSIVFDDTIENATKYNVQRAPSGNIWTDIGSSASSPYTDSGLVGGTYSYRIFVENNGDWGPVSNVMEGTTL